MACAYTDTEAGTLAEPTGSDFAIQGEYLGRLPDADSIGLQVVANGSGSFRVLLFRGGLPGAGWNGQSFEEANGQWNGASASFSMPSGLALSVDTLGQRVSGLTTDQKSFQALITQRESPTLSASPPAGAVVLFDGKNLTHWKNASLTDENYLLPRGTTEATGAVTVDSFRDFSMHVEFRVPFLPTARGQNRGNSGIYLQSRYELQILDSFGLFPSDTVEGSRQCGAIWEQARPLVNMCLPPYQWQTYDIDFSAARFNEAGDTLIQRAFVTVKQNGVVIHDHRIYVDRTVLGDFEGPNPGPHRLQWHGEEVVYRNIWLVEQQSSAARIRPIQHSGKRRLISFPGSSHSLSSPQIHKPPFTLGVDILGRIYTSKTSMHPHLTFLAGIID